jgi:ABC-type Fe3+/spermidine/putrescine transport system ATPase subunit
MNPVILSVRNLARTYAGVGAVADISFEVRKGELVALLGPSGCGKSTTLRLIAGLEEPDGGEIVIRGRTVAAAHPRVFVPAEKRNLGLVFQSYAIWPHMTVSENIAYPLEVRSYSRQQIRNKVAEILALVDLTGFEDRPATQLSGGQQQRVALARALAYEPDIVLLDEPLSNLDAKLRVEMRLQLRALQRRLGTTILYVTHDQIEAMSLADRIVVLNRGAIEQVGTPHQVYESPATYFVQNFVGRVVTLAEHIDAAAHGAATGRLAKNRIAVRPEDLIIEPVAGSSLQEPFSGVVEDVMYCGDHFECVVRIDGRQVICDVPKKVAVARGQTVVLRVDPSRTRAWPDEPAATTKREIN